MNSMSEMHAELDKQVRAKQGLDEGGSVLNDITELDRQLSHLKVQLKELHGKLANSK